ncbi:MAG: hypothetical protein HRT35_24175 [Algicola sp.]|nr:hypothetical protein [Algicola sp.]
MKEENQKTKKPKMKNLFLLPLILSFLFLSSVAPCLRGEAFDLRDDWHQLNHSRQNIIFRPFHPLFSKKSGFQSLLSVIRRHYRPFFD